MEQLSFGPYETLCLRHDGCDQNIVLLHGYGANCADLAPLAQVIATKQTYNWWFVNAPHKIMAFPGMDCRAWFPIDAEKLQSAMHHKNWPALQEQFQGDIANASAELVKTFLQSAGLTPAKTIIGGFSQGAMLASHTALTHSDDFKALLVFSGALASQEWSQAVQKKTHLPVFQSHGLHDPVIAYEPAKLLADLFEQASFDMHEFITFEGGHEIPVRVLQECAEFINQLN